MKWSNRKCLILLAIAFLSGLYMVSLPGNPEFEEEGEEEEERGLESGSARQMEYLWQIRSYPDPEYINDKFWEAWQHAQAMRSDILTNGNLPGNTNNTARTDFGAWMPVGNNLNVGRVLSITIDPNNNNNLFIGSASGGIWKSTNAATSWTYVSTGFPVLGVPAIAYHPGNSNIILAGTGEVYRSNLSNIGYNVWKARGTYGIGMLRSTDGGFTWTRVLVKNYSDLFGIQRIKFDPNNNNTVYACTTHGLFKSTDGGATWGATPMLSNFYISDVLVLAGNSNTIVAAVGNLTNANKGIYKTTNGGANWTYITTGGFPASYSGYVRLAAHTTTPNTIYASVGMGVTSPDGGRNYTDNEIYRSTDFGNTWGVRSNSNHSNYQFWFSHAIATNPTNPDIVIMAGINSHRYNVATQARTNFGTGVVHSDIHDVVFDPVNVNRLYIVSDGGVYRTNNINAGSPSFAEMNSGLRIAQFYAAFGVSATTANRFVGGLQDNGVWAFNGTSWSKEMGGDGGACVIAPNNDNVVYASNDARSVSKSTGGITGAYNGTLGSWAFVADDRTGFMAPIAISRSNPDVVYVASDNLHRTANAGGSWTNTGTGSTNYIEARFKTGIAMAVSPTNPNKIYVSLSPFSQRIDNNLNVVGQPSVRRSNNANAATPAFTDITPGLPNRFVLDFAVSLTNDDSVFVALGGYGGSHVYVTGNGGTTWVDRGVGLPDVPFNAIVIDPNNPQFIYAGCDLGVYVSNNRGLTWYDYNGGFQDGIQIFDLQVTASNRLVAATHGKGAWITDLATNAPLPVNILDFSGTNKNDFNEIRWKGSEERNVSHYELERKIDNGNFSVVAVIPARNNSGVFNYVHNDDIRNTGGLNYYYRLRAIDNDGSAKFSNVILIKVRRPGKMEMLGNPVNSNSSVRLTLQNPQRVVFRLFDMNGKLVRTSTVDASAGANLYPINNFGFIAKGQYTLQAISNEAKFSVRIIKLRE